MELYVDVMQLNLRINKIVSLKNDAKLLSLSTINLKKAIINQGTCELPLVPIRCKQWASVQDSCLVLQAHMTKTLLEC